MLKGSSKYDTEYHPEHIKSGMHINWGPTSAILYTFFLFFGGQFLAGLVFGILAVIFGFSQGLIEGGPNIAAQFYFVLISDAIMLSALWLFLRVRQNGFRQLGFRRGPQWADVTYAVIGYLVYFGLLIIVLSIIGPLTGINLEQEQELGFDNLLSTAEKVMGLIALVLLPPVVEELIFRGFLFGGLRTKMTFAWAAYITSLLFAVPHLFASSEGLLWVAGVDTFILSVILCYLREKTGALWAPMAVHAIKNAIAYTILLTGVAAA
jgi:CAAX amino terminal protease family.